MVNSVVVSGGGAVGTVAVAGVVKWAAMGCPSPMPDDVSVTIAAAIVIGLHVAYSALRRRFNLPAVPQLEPPQEDKTNA